MRDGGGPYPVVLFSYGLAYYRYQSAEKAENLASHGYIFVGIDHFDAQRPAFPDGLDGTVVNVPTTSVTTSSLEDRVRDLSFVLDEFVKWNGNDPMFAGRFDLARVAAMGFSWGGGAAGEFGRIDDRVKAVVLLDAYLQNADDLVQLGLPKPFIGMYSTALGGDTRLFTKATQDTIWFQVSSTEHGNFDDFYWGSFPGSLAAGREAARTINAYSLWFLNKHVKGSSDPMPALADYPRVVNFRQK